MGAERRPPSIAVAARVHILAKSRAEGRHRKPKARGNSEEVKPDVLNKAYDVIRPRITRLFLLTAFFCAAVIALIWVFELFDELSVRIFMSLVVAMVPAFEFQSSPKTWEPREELAWFTSFLILVLLIVVGDKFDWQGVGMNAVILLVALPYGWLVWRLMRRNWLLLTGLMLALALMMIYWVAALVVNEETLSILLLPVPVVIFGGIAWTPVAWRVLETARGWRNRRVGGPGMQVLAMAILFLPVVLVVAAVPGMLELSQVWSAVSLTLIGVLLSAVVSEPLRRFLLEWGNLKPDDETVPEV